MTKQPNPRRVAENEAQAIGNMLRVSARKLDLVAGLIRGKSAAAALSDLSFSKRRIALDVKKVLQSAIANAENNHQLDVDRLEVAEASVGKALVLRRVMPRARGRAAAIRKPFSRITVTVRERAGEAPAQPAAKGKSQAKGADKAAAKGKAATKGKVSAKHSAKSQSKGGKKTAPKSSRAQTTRAKEKV